MEAAKVKLIPEMRRKAIETAQLLHPLSDLEEVEIGRQNMYVVGDDEFRLDADFTVRMVGRVPNLLTNKFKKSRERIRVKGRIHWTSLGWRSNVVGADVL